MTPSETDLSESPNCPPGLVEIVAAIHRLAPRVEPVLVGPAARDILFGAKYGIWAPRATADIDLAFRVETWDEFRALKEALLQDPAFESVTDKEHKLRFGGRI